MSVREGVVVAAMLVGCSRSTPSKPKQRLCAELGTLQRSILDRHLSSSSPLSSGEALHEADCDKVALDVAFLDGYLQALDRGWSAVAEQDQLHPYLAEPLVGAWIGVSLSCRSGTWWEVGDMLEGMRSEIDARLEARLMHCEG